MHTPLVLDTDFIDQLETPATNQFAFDLVPAMKQFLVTLEAAKPTEEELPYMEYQLRQKKIHLNEIYSKLHELAAQGHKEEVSSLFHGWLCEWAEVRALASVVERKVWINPRNKGVQNAFATKLILEHSKIANCLVLPLHQGNQERAQKQNNQQQQQQYQQQQQQHHLTETLVQRAEQGIEQQFQQNRELAGMLTNVFQQYQQQFNTTPKIVHDAHEDSRESLRVAIEAVKETRAAAQDFLEPAVDLLKSAGDHAKQTTPDYVDKALDRASARRATRRIWFVVSIGLVVVFVLAAVFLGLMSLHLHPYVGY